MRRLYNKYRKLFKELKKAEDKKAEDLKKAKDKIKKIACLANVVETSILEVDNIKNSAKIAINSEDEKILATAGTVKKKLSESLTICKTEQIKMVQMLRISLSIHAK